MNARNEAAWARSIRLLIVIALAWAACACAPKDSPRWVVDHFIEAHYMAISLKGSEPYCTGLALSKLKQEEQLTTGQAIDDSTRKPLIHYSLTQERTEADRATYLFRAKIDVPDGGTFNKNWMI